MSGKQSENPTSWGHVGSICEVIASAWLLKKGYHVFRNESQHGPVDLIAFDEDTGETVLIDVKKISFITFKSTGVTELAMRRLSQKQVRLGIKMLLVDMDKYECRFFDPQAPERKL